MLTPSPFPPATTPDQKEDLRRFVAAFPDVARRVVDLNERSERDGCTCIACKVWLCDEPDHDPRGCWLRDLRAIVRESEFREATLRG